MMASRRWPSATPPSASTQTSPASGPRCRTVSIMASPIARKASPGVAARQSTMPAMPHILRLPFTAPLPNVSAPSRLDIVPERRMRPQMRGQIDFFGSQRPGHDIAGGPLQERQRGHELQVGIGRVVVLRRRHKAGLIEHVARVDALIDQMHGDAEIAEDAFRFRPVAAVYSAIFGGDAGMIVDERRID